MCRHRPVSLHQCLGEPHPRVAGDGPHEPHPVVAIVQAMVRRVSNTRVPILHIGDLRRALKFWPDAMEFRESKT